VRQPAERGAHSWTELRQVPAGLIAYQRGS
jgi:hypothetical protein